MTSRNTFFVAVLAVIATSVSALGKPPSNGASPFEKCRGFARYNVTFKNLMTPGRFGSSVPSDGFLLSPLTAAGHSNRVSILSVRGYASKAIEVIAETGDNSMLKRNLRKLRADRQGVKNLDAGSGPVMAGKYATVTVNVDCDHPFISAIAMIAPSPDWIVQISNMNMFSRRDGGFKRYSYGRLMAYDAGTDDGTEFSSPDSDTVPQKNIAPLVEDVTDPFEGRAVGKYIIKRIK